MNDPAHDAVGCEDRRVRLQPVHCPFVDGDRLRSTSRIASDDARNNGFSDARILKRRQRPDALSFEDLLALLCQLHPKLTVLLVQTKVFIADVDQGNVLAPNVANAKEGAIRKFFHWSKRIEYPHA